MTTYTRQQWGADNVELERISTPVSEVFLHHTATRASTDSKKDMKNIESGEQKMGYSTVAYTCCGHPNGDVLEGRILNGEVKLGGATKNNNSTSLAYCLIGDFTKEKPTAKALEACAQTIAGWVQKGWVRNAFQLRLHKEVFATACPGTSLIGKRTWIRVRVDQILQGADMSADKLTRAEITTLRRLAVGENPSEYVLEKYEGKPLRDYLDALVASEDRFIELVRNGTLIKAEDCPSGSGCADQIEAMYLDVIAGVDKAFGKT